MYLGHYALATAVKAKKPELPVMPIFLATGAIDIVNGINIMLGISRVDPNLETKPYLYFDLTQIDRDHSLLMGIVCSLVAGSLAYFFYRKDNTIGLSTTLVAFSHWLLDFPFHNADLVLYPGSSLKFGWGLWRVMGEYAWHLEVIFSLFLLIYAYQTSKKEAKPSGLRSSLWVFLCAICPLGYRR
ncbi:hypothetical protein [Streptococcus sp. E17BB]|uniref:hypothetical protein n=1 Tax=Streptococcus sp. E17BB TaxID=3278714 RepID=UPI00359EFC94